MRLWGKVDLRNIVKVFKRVNNELRIEASGKSMIRAVQMDGLRGLLGIRTDCTECTGERPVGSTGGGE